MSTMRDRIEAQRAGYVAGVRATTKGRWTPEKQSKAEALASEAYPIPTIERPRVVRAGSFEYMMQDGVLHNRTCGAGGYWRPTRQTRETVTEVLSLFDNPTETVEVQ